MTRTTDRGYAAMLIRDVPANIRKAVAKDALKQGMAFSDVVGLILGEAYGVLYEPSGKALGREHVGGSQPDVTIRVPPELRTRIRVAAAAMPKGTVRGVVIDAVAQHYGKKAPPPERRPRLSTNRLSV